MKSISAITLTALTFVSLSSHAAPATIHLSVGGEISPGVYGNVQFGNAPPPPVFYPQPRIIVSQPEHASAQPIYLHVPPGHAKNWAKHCRKYDACNQPVYLVKSAEYEPGYSKRKKNDRHGEGHQNEKHHGDGHRGEKHDDKHGDDRHGGGHRD